MARVIGIDVGDRWLGIAVGDDRQRVATPREEIQVAKPAEIPGAIARLAAEEQAVAIVVGMPYTLRGEIGPQAESVLRVIKTLRGQLTIPIHEIDERLTSKEAQQSQNRPKAGKPPRREDSVAAALILQTWFDRLPQDP